jgi:butyryl-CoA dehydrogenase
LPESQSAYNAAKFAVRGFTDALRMELEITGSPVSCTTVHPGGIKTEIARRARIDPGATGLLGARADAAGTEFDRALRTTPESAARQILAAVERDRRRVLVGPDARFVDLVARLPAGLYQRALVAGARLRGRPARRVG